MNTAEFRKDMIDLVGNIDFRSFYAYAPKIINEYPAFVIDGIRDRRVDGDENNMLMSFSRQTTIYCMSAIKDNNNEYAELEACEFADAVTSSVLSGVSASLTLREPMRYAVGGREVMAVRLVFEHHITEAL